MTASAGSKGLSREGCSISRSLTTLLMETRERSAGERDVRFYQFNSQGLSPAKNQLSAIKRDWNVTAAFHVSSESQAEPVCTQQIQQQQNPVWSLFFAYAGGSHWWNKPGTEGNVQHGIWKNVIPVTLLSVLQREEKWKELAMFSPASPSGF